MSLIRKNYQCRPGNDKLRRKTSRRTVSLQLIISRHQPENINTGASFRRNSICLADLPPTVRDVRRKAESAFIGKINIQSSLCLRGGQLGDFSNFLSVLLRIRRSLQDSSEAFPGITEFFLRKLRSIFFVTENPSRSFSFRHTSPRL